MKITDLHLQSKRILLELEVPSTRSSGGILLPGADSTAKRNYVGKVLALGADVDSSCGISVGDRVCFEPGLQYDFYLDSLSKLPTHAIVWWFDVLMVLPDSAEVELHRN